MSGLDELDRMIAKCRGIPKIAKRAAPEVAEAVRKSILETVNAGTDTEGKAWTPRKDGGRPLEHAAAAVKVAAVGTRILARVAGPEARHHSGRAKGGTMRGIIPTRLTPRIADAVRKVLAKHFRAVAEEG
jgi:hypothetical protein